MAIPAPKLPARLAENLLDLNFNLSFCPCSLPLGLLYLWELPHDGSLTGLSPHPDYWRPWSAVQSLQLPIQSSFRICQTQEGGLWNDFKQVFVSWALRYYNTLILFLGFGPAPGLRNRAEFNKHALCLDKPSVCLWPCSESAKLLVETKKK